MLIQRNFKISKTYKYCKSTYWGTPSSKLMTTYDHWACLVGQYLYCRWFEYCNQMNPKKSVRGKVLWGKVLWGKVLCGKVLCGSVLCWEVLYGKVCAERSDHRHIVALMHVLTDWRLEERTPSTKLMTTYDRWAWWVNS